MKWRCALTADYKLLFYIQIRWTVSELQWFIMWHHFWSDQKYRDKLRINKFHVLFLILVCKSLVVNISLKFGTSPGFICGDALPGPYCKCLQFLHVLGAFSPEYCPQQMEFMVHQIQLRWLTWSWCNIPLLCLKKLPGCFRSTLQVIVHLHRESSSKQLWSIWLNVSR